MGGEGERRTSQRGRWQGGDGGQGWRNKERRRREGSQDPGVVGLVFKGEVTEGGAVTLCWL